MRDCFIEFIHSGISLKVFQHMGWLGGDTADDFDEKRRVAGPIRVRLKWWSGV